MKNLILITSAFALLTPAFSSAADCDTLPSCETLGYTDTAAECPRDSSASGKPSALLCPLDLTKGKCIYEGAVGQIAYFPKACPQKNGWLMCDGKRYNKTQYPLLEAVLGTKFCTSNHGTSSETCSSGTNFKVPDYRGYFLRTAATTSANVIAPQAESLPNLRGYFGLNSGSLADEKLFSRINAIDNSSVTRTWRKPNGDIISKTAMWQENGSWIGLDNAENGGWTTHSIQFNASVHNSIYKTTATQAHVVPANIAVYPCIYAGKCVGSGCY